MRISPQDVTIAVQEGASGTSLPLIVLHRQEELTSTGTLLSMLPINVHWIKRISFCKPKLSCMCQAVFGNVSNAFFMTCAMMFLDGHITSEWCR